VTFRMTAIFVLLLCATAFAQGQRRIKQSEPKVESAKLATHEGKYYVIHTDLSRDEVREADLRMSKMAEEYHERTKDFAGEIREKFPFYLFRNEADFIAAGGKPGSAGVYMNDTRTLMAIAGEALTADTWHTVQHEGFHQFAVAVIGGELPIWVNEGLAEYFGEAVFTGDGFVVGVIPEWRRERIVKTIRARKFLPIRQIMLLTHPEWNADLRLENYDQAWSMVHFLIHAEEGKYRNGFAKFIRAVGAEQPWEKAWLAHIGPADGFEQRWRDYWLKLPSDPTNDLLAQATVKTLTNFVARAASQGQRFTSMKELVAAAKTGEVKVPEKDWLPPGLLVAALLDVQRMMQENGDRFTIETPPGKLPHVRHVAKDGTELVGRFTLRAGRVNDVVVVSGNKNRS